MNMHELVRDLEDRRARIRAMGGPDKIARQHDRGKLTARERLAAFFDDFEAALGTADERLVVETFASAREQGGGGDARRLAARARGTYAPDVETAARDLAARVRPGDVVLILGAGDVRPVGERLLTLLAAGSPA